jgi:hypothetical protein
VFGGEVKKMADGRWQMADGRWWMVDGGWQMVDQNPNGVTYHSPGQRPGFPTRKRTALPQREALPKLLPKIKNLSFGLSSVALLTFVASMKKVAKEGRAAHAPRFPGAKLYLGLFPDLMPLLRRSAKLRNLAEPFVM